MKPETETMPYIADIALMGKNDVKQYSLILDSVA